MTSLAHLIQKTGYQKLFKHKKSDVYLKALKAQERDNAQKSFIFFTSFWIGLIGGAVLRRALFLEHFFPIFFTVPLSAMLAAALQNIYFKIKSGNECFDFKTPMDMMAQHEKDFSQHLTQKLSSSASIIELFQAFETEATIPHHFDLPKIFKDTNEHLKSMIEQPKKQKKHQDAIVALITPIFSHYLEESLIKNRLPSALSEEEVATYQAVLRRSENDAYNRDFLCTSTTPPELINLNPRQSMSASRA